MTKFTYFGLKKNTFKVQTECEFGILNIGKNPTHQSR